MAWAASGQQIENHFIRVATICGYLPMRTGHGIQEVSGSIPLGSTMRPKSFPTSPIRPKMAGLPLGYQMASNCRLSDPRCARRQSLERPDHVAAPLRRGKGLTAQEAAEVLGVKVSTLAKWRQLGIGPPLDRLGRDPRYHPDDLDEFLWGEGVVRNSVEAKHRRRKRRRTQAGADQETA